MEGSWPLPSKNQADMAGLDRNVQVARVDLLFPTSIHRFLQRRNTTSTSIKAFKMNDVTNGLHFRCVARRLPRAALLPGRR